MSELTNVILELPVFRLVYKRGNGLNTFCIQERGKPYTRDKVEIPSDKWVDRWYPDSMDHALRMMLDRGAATSGRRDHSLVAALKEWRELCDLLRECPEKMA